MIAVIARDRKKRLGDIILLQMLFKIALIMWVAALLIGLLATGKERTWMVKLAYAGFCLLLLAALIKLVRI